MSFSTCNTPRNQVNPILRWTIEYFTNFDPTLSTVLFNKTLIPLPAVHVGQKYARYMMRNTRYKLKTDLANEGKEGHRIQL